MQDNYTTIARKLRNMETFKGNTMRAELDSRGNYRVFSYATEIAIAYAVGGRSMTTERFSVTTSKHQGLIAWAWFGDSITNLRKRTAN